MTISGALLRNHRRDDGAVAIIVAALATAIFVIAAFAVDFGIAYSSKRALVAAVDGAVLSGAQAAGEKFALGQDCEVSLTAMSEAAKGAAVETYAVTAPKKSLAFTAESITVECLDSNGDGVKDVVDVSARATAEWDTVFGGVAGIDALRPNADAVARVGGSPVYGGLRPFIVCDTVANAAEPGVIQTSYFSTSTDLTLENCGDAAGNWGLLDFQDLDTDATCDGKQDALGVPNGENQAFSWYTAQGYPCGVPIPGDPTTPDDDIPSKTGAPYNSSILIDAINAMMGQPVLLPVTNDYPGNGKTAYPGIGVLAVEMCGWAQTTNPNGDWQVGDTTDCWVGGLEPPADYHPGFAFQWKVVEYTTSYGGGDPSQACDLAEDDGCVATIRLVE